MIREVLAKEQTAEVKKQSKRLTVCKKRSAELERLLNKIYKDNVLGRLPEKRYQSLLDTYGQEQEALDKEIAGLQSTVERYENGSERAKNFINLVERYTDALFHLISLHCSTEHLKEAKSFVKVL